MKTKPLRVQLNARVPDDLKRRIKAISDLTRLKVESIVEDAFEFYMGLPQTPDAKNRRAACVDAFKRVSRP